MGWVRIDDQFPEHPRVAQAGPLAMAMQVAALCYCNRKLTDGFVPRSVARTLLDWEFMDSTNRIYTIAVTSGMSGDDAGPEMVIDLLLESGMWSVVPGGFQIERYLEFQPSREQVEGERKAARDRMARGRKGSDDVRANNERTSDAPNPTPNPKESSSSRGSLTQGADEPVDDDEVEVVLQAIADLQTSRAAGVDYPKRYRAKCLRNARIEFAARVRELLAEYDAPASLIAAAAAFGETRNLGHYRRKAS